MRATLTAILSHARNVVLALAALFVAATAASAQELPQFGKDAHLGVASCAGSTCHGAVQPWRDSPVLQNEYVTWQREDRHSKAYETLLNDRSKRIARNLGLPNAHTAQVCLDCHANNVPKELQGRQFQISDGVGCESCHGGAVRWLGIHVSGIAGHAENVKAGLYPTPDPVKRAELCLSCHFGIDKLGRDRKFVTHRIMGAGHPRMSFELDTFTSIQPAHFVVDADYRKRKRAVSGLQTWAIGQAIQVRELLQMLSNTNFNKDGIFPELVFFDCHACHHPMSNLRWQPRESSPLGPGIVRLNDSNMIMLCILATQIDPGLGGQLRELTSKLHIASTQGTEATIAVAKEMTAVAVQLVERFGKHTFEKKDMQALLNGLVQEGLRGEFVDYATAEQATMALSSVIAAMRNTSVIDDATYKKMNEALATSYEATAKDEAYRPEQFVEAMKRLAEAMPKA